MKPVYTLGDLRRWHEATHDCAPPLRLAVIGDPVAHSKSPLMHNAALAASNIDARYTRLHIRPEELPECLSLLPAAGFLGINCTIPHKGGVLAAIQHPDVIARRAGGVNTVTVEPNGTLSGTSTDGPGFARAVHESFGKELREFRPVILGAGGGAGRALAMQCASAGCAGMFLLNRSLEKLEPLLEEIAAAYPQSSVAAGALDELFLRAALKNCDLVVNCTALGMKPGDPSPVPSALLSPSHAIYDTIYVSHRTPLLAAGDRAGARGENGLSMLLHQGALSFERWFSRPAPLNVMRAALLAA